MKLAPLLLAVLVVFDLALIYGTGCTLWVILTPLALAAFCGDWARE